MKEHINLLKICVFCGLVFSSLFFTSASFAHSFEAGEELIYDVKVMGIKAGVQKMKCAGIVDYKQRLQPSQRTFVSGLWVS